MLKGISPFVSPELLKTLCEMGHGDEIVLADAYFPAHTTNARVIRADGVRVADLLAGIAPLWCHDRYAVPVAMMAPVEGDKLDPKVERTYRKALDYTGPIDRIERVAFYERTRRAYAVVQTSETFQYGNILLRKGNFS